MGTLVTTSAFRQSPFLKLSHTRPRLGLYARHSVYLARRYNTESGKVSEPLRILFCGSDEFSCTSLNNLYQEQMRNAGLIKSIDVVVRPPKRVGRGRKEIREVPLKKLAEELKLPTHERDTFTGWNMPSPGGEDINLIIAVSFGLFVPPRLLRAARYGGLNVHPSLLPDLRGPAPLHHAILQGDTHTGVSIQTLSEETFDAGLILAQTPKPGLPIRADSTVSTLTTLTADLGGEMLVKSLRAGAHVPPFVSVGWQPTPNEVKSLRHAPKISTADGQVRWAGQDAWGAQAIVRTKHAVPKVWTQAVDQDAAEKRLHLQDMEVVARNAWPQDVSEFMQVVDHKVRIEIDGGRVKARDEARETVEINDELASRLRIVTWVQEDVAKNEAGSETKTKTKIRVRMPYFVDGDSIIVPTVTGDCLRIKSIKVEGDREKPAAVAIGPFGETYAGEGREKGFMGTVVDGMTLGVSSPISWLQGLLP